MTIYHLKGVPHSDELTKNYQLTLQFSSPRRILASFSSMFWFYRPVAQHQTANNVGHFLVNIVRHQINPSGIGEVQNRTTRREYHSSGSQKHDFK